MILSPLLSPVRQWRTGALALALGLLTAASARAQLGIQVKTDRPSYFTFEPVYVTVTLRNNSGNPLVFSDQKPLSGFVNLKVASADDRTVALLCPAPNLGMNLILGTGETKDLTVRLDRLFNLQRGGSYLVHALGGHDRLPEDYRSDPVQFVIQSGLPIWQKRLGAPAAGAKDAIATRQICLLLMTERKTDQFALMVEDDNTVYGFKRLGQRISGTKPVLDVDALSNVHVLWMSKPRLFEHRVYDRDLRLLQTKYYVADRSVPTLQRDPDIGRIMIAGGRPATPGVDFKFDATDTGNMAVSPAGTPTQALHGAPTEAGPAPASTPQEQPPDAGLQPVRGILGPTAP